MAKEIEEFRELHKIYLYVDYKISDLAKRLNISRKTVERWLSSKTKPSKEKLKAIKEYLDEKKRMSS
jgi:transcriptional regulator with XRE-family HTH domain